MGTYSHHRRVQVAKLMRQVLRVSFCPLPDSTPNVGRCRCLLPRGRPQCCFLQGDNRLLQCREYLSTRDLIDPDFVDIYRRIDDHQREQINASRHPYPIFAMQTNRPNHNDPHAFFLEPISPEPPSLKHSRIRGLSNDAPTPYGSSFR